MDNPRPQPTVIWKLFCGGLAGAIAQTCTYPLDLVRRRFQVMGMRDVASGAPASPTATSGAAAAGITAGIKGSSDYGFRYGSTWDALKTVGSVGMGETG